MYSAKWSGHSSASIHASTHATNEREHRANARDRHRDTDADADSSGSASASAEAALAPALRQRPPPAIKTARAALVVATASCLAPPATTTAPAAAAAAEEEEEEEEEGAMGEGEVAVKVMLISSRTNLQMLENEIAMMMLSDHPTTGGYPVIAVVHPDDVPAVAQHAAGTSLRFRLQA